MTLFFFGSIHKFLIRIVKRMQRGMNHDDVVACFDVLLFFLSWNEKMHKKLFFF